MGAIETGHFWNCHTGMAVQGGRPYWAVDDLYSLDAMNWFQAGCIARAETVQQSFMYGKPTIVGDDLCVISRTSSAKAPNQHDADLATFHRIPNFRGLALDLRP